MEEFILKLAAGAGGVGISATWAYWLWKLEPRLKAIEVAIYTQGRIDLLKLAASATVAPELKEVGNRILAEVEEKLKLLTNE